MSDKLDNQITLGEQLKQARTVLKLSIDDVSDRTQIPAKYIYWLEKGEYDKLPALVYAQGFLVKCSKILNLEKGKLLDIYLKETEEFCKSSDKKYAVCNAEFSRIKTYKFIITPKVLAVSLSALVAVGMLGYFGWQMNNLIRPPEIVLESPNNDLAVDYDRLAISGKIMGANILMMNDRIVNFNEATGQFSEPLSLSEGLNVVELKAQNRIGKETTVIRKIIFEKQ